MAEKQYRVLLIVPESGLGVVPEVDAMFDLGYSPQVVQGLVTRERIFQVIRSRSFDIIHYAGHANRDGVELSDGQLDGPSLVQIAKAVNAQLLFLNGCETVELGQALVDEHVPVVICTLRNVNDAMARETSQLFYKAFAKMGDARAAYNMSKPPIKGGYSILTNGQTDISLAPVLEKLAEFAVFIQRNDSEHQAILATISANETEHDRIMHSLKKTAVWNLAITISAVVLVGLIIGMFSLIGRGVLP